MISYTISQWVLIFFIYGFVGWIWESCVVSIQKHRWVNRGFLHGTILPIYGFGALIILLFTLNVRKRIELIFLFGMVGATFLEYVTGYLMEKIFHVRYWDYSKQKFNLHGYVCLGCSLGWGAFSVILVKVIHKCVEQLVFIIPDTISRITGGLLVIGFIIDIVVSVLEALNLKDELKNISKNNQNFNLAKAKMKEIFSPENNEEKRDIITEESEQRNIAPIMLALEKVDNAIYKTKKVLMSELSTLERKTKERQLKELIEVKRILLDLQENLSTRNKKSYRRALSILKRNPSATSDKYKEAVEEIHNEGNHVCSFGADEIRNFKN